MIEEIGTMPSEKHDEINQNEICCGQDVKRGSGLFANRVPECNDYQTKVEMGRRFPEGEWICIICDNTDSDGIIHNTEGIYFSIRFEKDCLRMLDRFLKGRKQIR